MSALSSNRDSDDNQVEPLEEERGLSSDTLLKDLLFENQKRLIKLREAILPNLIAILGALLTVFLFMLLVFGNSFNQYYLESITELVKVLLWLKVISILAYVFGDSMINSIMSKIN